MPLALRSLLFLLATAGLARAQVVTGTVTDADTGEGLPAATVQVAGTYTGTITNGAGRYELRVAERPATLVVRFIGYEPAEVAVAAGQEALDVALEPAALVGPEVVVTDENPAEAIMRRVIERKRVWQAGLRSWRAEAYVRQVFGREGEIVGIAEAVTEAYWRRGEGVREVIQATRSTENLPDLGALSAADAVINFYDDEVAFGGYDLMGPTSPDALGFYRFSLEGVRRLGDDLVYDIALRSRNGLQPGFEGRVSVLGGAYALLDVALRPNASVRFPFVSAFGVAFAQQFSSFGQEVAGEAVWLPVDYRLTATAKLGMIGLQFPMAELQTVARLTDYAINAAAPDSLFEARRRAVVDSAAVASGAALGRTGLVVPLEPREAEAYARLDSTDSLAEAFQPTGPLARFVDLAADEDGASASAGGSAGLGLSIRPALWFNRVEGLHVGASVGRRAGPVGLRGGIGYSAEPGLFTYEGALTARVPASRRVRLSAALGLRREVAPRVGSAFHGRLLNSAALLAGGPDYFDYYRREGGFAEVGVELRRLRTRLTLTGTAEEHGALRAVSFVEAFGDESRQRPNPQIEPGTMRSLGAELVVGDGPGGLAASVAGRRGLRLRVEAADPALLGGDYAFVRAEAELGWRAPTFLRRRLFPNTLDVRLAGGLHGGRLPLQRHFGLDGTVLGFAPSGVFRSLRGRPVEGDRYAVVAWEHDFRSVPFELFGLEALAVRNVGLLVHGAHGRTWLGDPSAGSGQGPAPRDPLAPLRTSGGWLHEVGVSVSGGFFVPLRLDLTYRVDDPGLFVSFGIARLF
jgi:hypothetical protein